MADDVYKKMLEVMKNRRGPYTGIDIPEFYPLVQELFRPEEAQVNNAMPGKPATAKDIAKELGRPENDIVTTLETMADRGLCKTFLKDDVRYYQGEPFMPGIFEYQFMPGKTTGKRSQVQGSTFWVKDKEGIKDSKSSIKMLIPPITDLA